MKKLLLFAVAAVFAVAFLPAVKVNAKSEYLRVVTGETPFYSDRDASDFLFYLPYTYYVRVLSAEGEISHVECYGAGAPKIDGYTYTELLFDDGLEVENPYVNLTVITSKNAAFYADKDLKTVSQYIFPERSLYYYGKASFEGGNIFYVFYNGKLGYVKEEDVYPFSVADHPNALTFLSTESSSPEKSAETEKTESEDSLAALRITIIVCLIFAGLLATFLIKRPKKEPAVSYYDENEFE